jgi:hypothetical protein
LTKQSYFFLSFLGLISFYTDYLSTLHSLIPSIEIYGISLTGHSFSFSQNESLISHLNYFIPSLLSRGKDLITLDDQIEDKLRFIEYLIHKHDISIENSRVKLVLAGHSVGAYILSKVHKRLSKDLREIISVHGLFPTLSNLIKTPNAEKLKYLISYMGCVYLTLMSLFFWIFIPSSILSNLFYSFSNHLSSVFSRLIVNIPKGLDKRLSTILANLALSPTICLLCPWMAIFEFKQILEPDVDWLKENKNILTLYFGQAEIDGWVPAPRIEEIRSALGINKVNPGEVGPKVKGEPRFQICGHGLPHAFSLGERKFSSMMLK